MEASKASGIPQSTISTSERESHGSTDTAIYAKLYGVNAHWLATGEGEMLDKTQADPINREASSKPFLLPSSSRKTIFLRGKIRLLDTRGNYEEQALLESERGAVMFWSSDPDAYGMPVKGDQLHPMLRNNDILIIEPNTIPQPGDRVLVHLLDGRKMVRELIMQRHGEYVLEAVMGGDRLTVEAAELQPVRGLQYVRAIDSPRSRKTYEELGISASEAPTSPPPPP